MTGVLLVCLAAALWGTVGTANGLMTGGASGDPVLAGMIRTALGGLSLLAAAEIMRLPRTGLRRGTLSLLFAFAIAGAVFQTTYLAAFAQVGVTVTVAVVCCAPVILVAAGEALRYRRRPEPGVSLAIATASAGVLLATLGGGDWESAGVAADWRGIVLLATASLSYAIVVVTARAIGLRMHPLHGTGLGLGLTAVALALCVLVMPQASVAKVFALPGLDLANLAYTGVVATGGAYLAFVLGMRLSRSAAAGLAATLIEPGVAALLAALVLGERLANPEVAGCALMLVAMVVLFRSEQRAEAAAARRRVDLPLGELSHDGAS